jgi:hypothetical protein
MIANDGDPKPCDSVGQRTPVRESRRAYAVGRPIGTSQAPDIPLIFDRAMRIGSTETWQVIRCRESHPLFTFAIHGDQIRALQNMIHALAQPNVLVQMPGRTGRLSLIGSQHNNLSQRASYLDHRQSGPDQRPRRGPRSSLNATQTQDRRDDSRLQPLGRFHRRMMLIAHSSGSRKPASGEEMID